MPFAYGYIYIYVYTSKAKVFLGYGKIGKRIAIQVFIQQLVTNSNYKIKKHRSINLESKILKAKKYRYIYI